MAQVRVVKLSPGFHTTVHLFGSAAVSLVGLTSCGQTPDLERETERGERRRSGPEKENNLNDFTSVILLSQTKKFAPKQIWIFNNIFVFPVTP